MPKIVPRRTRMKVFDRIPLYDPSKPMTANQVAEFLGFTPRYVYQLVDEKKIPATKIGNRLFFNPRVIYELAGMSDYLPRDFELV
ncbi:MAG: helix-turn-helix domain-containing protein [Eggerthellaceae bacterium]|nr:helix-turn-helix domain-containing protein [Eggerthellaceae bacterium]